jgi:hypothetical protein|nr:MAG TPA: Pyocin activator protein PrtN [Caudoviricetes sp.]
MAQRWTDREIRYLESKYLNQAVSITAKRLNRTERAVVKKALDIGLSKVHDVLSVNKLAECFNVTHKVVMKWINQYDLPCRKFKCSCCTKYMIDLENFWKWAEQHKDIINWSRYNCTTLALEPAWVRCEKFSYDRPNKGKYWTDMEIKYAKSMLRRGMSYREVAKELGRTQSGVAHKCAYIYNG